MSKTKKAVIVIKEDPDGTVSATVDARSTAANDDCCGFLAFVGLQAIVKCINDGESGNEAY